MGVVYARYDTTVVWSGGLSVTALGDVWDDGAELVAERPELFSAEPTRVRGRTARPAAEAPDVSAESEGQDREQDPPKRARPSRKSGGD